MDGASRAMHNGLICRVVCTCGLSDPPPGTRPTIAAVTSCRPLTPPRPVSRLPYRDDQDYQLTGAVVSAWPKVPPRLPWACGAKSGPRHPVRQRLGAAIPCAPALPDPSETARCRTIPARREWRATAPENQPVWLLILSFAQEMPAPAETLCITGPTLFPGRVCRPEPLLQRSKDADLNPLGSAGPPKD